MLALVSSGLRKCSDSRRHNVSKHAISFRTGRMMVNKPCCRLACSTGISALRGQEARGTEAAVEALPGLIIWSGIPRSHERLDISHGIKSKTPMARPSIMCHHTVGGVREAPPLQIDDLTEIFLLGDLQKEPIPLICTPVLISAFAKTGRRLLVIMVMTPQSLRYLFDKAGTRRHVPALSI